MNLFTSISYFFFLLISIGFTVLTEKYLLKKLSGKASQPIYAEGPSWHRIKSGTPTMGGLAFLAPTLFCLVLSLLFISFVDNDNKTFVSIIISLIYSLCNAFIGIFDDLTKLKRKVNAGLSPLQKLFFQFLFSILFLMARKYYLGDSTLISLGTIQINLGYFYYPFAMILLLGITNCANLTDGIDGLCASVSTTIGAVFFLLSCFTHFDVAIVSLLLFSISISFLLFNSHPAKIFMGDTGSLFIGALAGSIAFAFNDPVSAIFIGGVYVIEGISVILQVLFFKVNGKRLLKMAPLHHHLEKCGMSENKICIFAILVTLLCSILSIIL